MGDWKLGFVTGVRGRRKGKQYGVRRGTYLASGCRVHRFAPDTDEPPRAPRVPRSRVRSTRLKRGGEDGSVRPRHPCSPLGPPRPDPHLRGSWPAGSRFPRRPCSPLRAPLGCIGSLCSGPRERRWRRREGGVRVAVGMRGGGEQEVSAGGGGTELGFWG
jgi:hypothetical protein